MPKFTQRHYQAIAETIRDLHENSPVVDHLTASSICDRFGVMFKRDNPNFKHDKFHEACGLDGWRDKHKLDTPNYKEFIE